MIVDLNQYRTGTKPAVQAWLTSQRNETTLESIGLIALSTNCPIIAVAHFAAEIVGMSPEIQAFLDRLMTFYKIDTVTGQLPLSE